ncbi:molecular chaperone TorD family protein [Halobacteriaceae archaeon GCM10025711]
MSEAAAVAGARAGVYRLLAAVFDGDVDALAAALDEGAFETLTAALPLDVDTDALATARDREALQVGHDNLFAVPGPHYVPPFASAHAAEPTADFESDSRYHEAGRMGELLGDPAVVAVSYYDRFGFRPSCGDGLPDHLAAELEFVGALAALEATLADGDDESAYDEVRDNQRTFLAYELAWLDAFASRVADADRAEGLFAALAAFTRAFVAWDADAVAAELGAPAAEPGA